MNQQRDNLFENNFCPRDNNKHLNKQTGNQGEHIAERYLIDEGYQILHRGFHCRVGEIDIIAKTTDIDFTGREVDVIAFVEVKTRRSGDYGRACMAVDIHKQRKIIRVAEQFMCTNMGQDHLWCDGIFRFDVIEINTWITEPLRHIKNAFQVN
ncbi:MAG: YraN family protein [Clostridiales Family XIII bacterium]|jgi:putative endonuclease|nr:YraN family protein [Clostridiales Family XIII bacterium]